MVRRGRKVKKRKDCYPLTPRQGWVSNNKKMISLNSKRLMKSFRYRVRVSMWIFFTYVCLYRNIIIIHFILSFFLSVRSKISQHLLASKGIRQWPINWCIFPMMIHKSTPRLKRLDTQLNEPTNKNSINVPKVFRPTNKKPLL